MKLKKILFVIDYIEGFAKTGTCANNHAQALSIMKGRTASEILTTKEVLNHLEMKKREGLLTYSPNQTKLKRLSLV